MREILFRAKRIDNGEWVEGFYSQLPKPSLGATIITNGDLCAEDVSDYIIVNQCKQHSNFSNGYPLEIVECEYYEIDSETLCQYTELKDNNGNRIWENDIIKHEISCTIGTVKWYQEDYAGWCVDDIVIDEQQFTDEMWSECEAIGNIFDNPELLKGE